MRNIGEIWVLMFLQPALISASHASSAVQIVSFDTNKTLYEFHEPVVFRARVRSEVPSSSQWWEIWVQRGVEAPKRIARARLPLPEGDHIQVIQYTCNSGHIEYGHAARFVIKDSTGRVLASQTWVYEVYREWEKVTRLLFVGGYIFALDSTPVDFIEQVMQRARDARVTTIEIFGIGDWQSLPPDAEDMTYTMRHENKTKEVPLRRSKVQHWIRLARDNGMHVIGYDEFSAMADVPPTDRVYFGPWDSPDVAGKLRVYPTGHFLVNPLKTRETAIRNVCEQIRRFDFDGLWFDSTAGWLVESVTRNANAAGQPLTHMNVDELTEWWFRPTLEAARKLKPKFVAFVNNAAHYLLYPAHGFPPERSKEIYGTIACNVENIRYSKPGNTLRKQIELFPMWCSETDPDSMRRGWFATYENLLMVCKSIKRLTRKPFLLTAQITGLADQALKGEAYAKPFMAVLLATGTGFSDHFALHGGLLTGNPHDPTIKAMVDYWNFAARYAEYLYDLNIRWASDAKVAVEGPSSLYWEDSVFERRYPDGTEHTYVHLLNLPEDHRIAVAHNVPTPARGASLMIKVPKAMKVKAFLLSPDGQSFGPAPLKCETMAVPRSHLGTQWRITGLPPILYWSMVVIEMKPS